LLVKKYHSFIDKDSNQPAAEGTFMFELRSVIGGCPQAVLHGILGLLVITEHAVRDQRKSATVSRKQNVQGFAILLRIAYGLIFTPRSQLQNSIHSDSLLTAKIV
jgi:hypothetical protein